MQGVVVAPGGAIRPAAPELLDGCVHTLVESEPLDVELHRAVLVSNRHRHGLYARDATLVSSFMITPACVMDCEVDRCTHQN